MRRIIIGIVGIFVLIIVLGYIGKSTKEERINQVSSVKQSTTPTTKPSPIESPGENELDTQTRKTIYIALWEAEGRADKEAEAMYPTDARNPLSKTENAEKKFDKFNELADKYRAGVRAKYNIDEKTQAKIIFEGAKENWSAGL